MKEVYEKLVENLASMTPEEKEKEWEELKKYNEIGPSVEEIIKTNNMEHKIDEIFDFFGTKIKCVDSKNRHCSDCLFFDFSCCYMYTSLLGHCNKRDRSDKNDVHFELLNKNE